MQRRMAQDLSLALLTFLLLPAAAPRAMRIAHVRVVMNEARYGCPPIQAMFRQGGTAPRFRISGARALKLALGIPD